MHLEYYSRDNEIDMRCNLYFCNFSKLNRKEMCHKCFLKNFQSNIDFPVIYVGKKLKIPKPEQIKNVLLLAQEQDDLTL